MSTEVSADEIRSYILDHFRDQLDAKGLDPAQVPDDFDLLAEGVIDSFGILEMIMGMEDQFGLTIDLENLDPEELTMIGPLSRFVATQTSS
jgi:acyl carrier protein